MIIDNARVPGEVALVMFAAFIAYGQTGPALLRRDIAPPLSQQSRGTPFSRALNVGDFNGDGRKDIAISGAPADERISILYNAGGGKFETPVHIAYRASGLLTAADVNGDGRADLIDGAWWDFSGRILLNRGNSRFEPQATITGLRYPLAVGDFNGDRIVDIVHESKCSDEPAGCLPGLRVMLGVGDGAFRRASTHITTQITDLNVADFDGDGRADVGARVVKVF